jgi:hypothetical protein
MHFCFLFLGSSSRSFGGKSFVRYKLKETFNQPSRSVGLAIKTVKSEGTLVFAAGQYDYNILEVIPLNIATCKTVNEIHSPFVCKH